MAKSLEAIRTLERIVLNAHDVGGIVLRYGSFYGPGTSLSAGGKILEMVRRCRLRLVGNGAGVWSFIHIIDAVYVMEFAVEH
jgi:2-alkyl-3-oxoalkanoate reductase